MAKGALAEIAQTDDEFPREILEGERQTWLCPRCEIEVELTKDRVIEHIVEHPTTILRETCYWRCPACNAAAGRETLDHVEPIAYISSKP